MELKNIKKDIVNKAKKLDSMAIDKTKKFLWCPHNYRRRINKKNKPIALTKTIKSAIKKKTGNKINYTERTNKYTIINYNKLTIEINPNCIVVVYPSEKWYRMEGSMTEINNRLDKIVRDIKNKCLRAAREISKLLNLELDFKDNKWIRNEDHIKSDEFLGRIAPELIVHDKLFKKVYPEGIEFKSPFDLKTFVNNRAIEMVAPIIAQKLDNLADLKELTRLEIYNKKLHMKVLHSMDRTMKNISKSMKHLNSNILKVKYEGRQLSGLERMVIKC